MEGMAARVKVVQDKLDDRVVREDIGMGVGAVDLGIIGNVWVGRTEDGVKGGNEGSGVGDVIEKGVVGAGGEVGHGYVEGYGLIWQREDADVVAGA